MLRAALVLLILLGGPALSQEPSQQKPESATADQSATGQQSTPAQQPIIVNVVPSPKTESEKDEERHERQEKAELDKKLVDLTAELSRYTGGLYAATVVLAIATIFLVIGTFGLVWLALKQARDMKASIDLARKEFVATHRPRIIIRFIQGPWDMGGNRAAFITFVNIGDSPGTITAIGADLAVWRIDARHWEPPGLEATPVDILPQILLESGQRHTHRVNARGPWGDAQRFAETTESIQTILEGAIEYRDGNGVLRQTGFSRVLDPRFDTFHASKSPEEEYQD